MFAFIVSTFTQGENEKSNLQTHNQCMQTLFVCVC